MAAAAISAVQRRRYLDELAGARGESPAPTSPQSRKATVDLPEQGTGIWRWQRQAAWAYIQMPVQLFVAGLISGNFLANVIEKWIDPYAEEYLEVWDAVDMFFNIMFSIELVWNMYAFWFRRFWKSAWNVFDFVVVSIGLLNMTKVPLPGPLSLLRMMRAFRVFRLFKRVESLNAIIVSLARSVPGVSNAGVFLLLVMCIYAIVGQEFFMLHGASYSYRNDLGEEVALMTARGLQYGYDYWGNFGLALFTVFQVLTHESWSEVIGRPLINSNDGFQTLGTSIFFVSYQLVVGVVLINVMIAILLEKMMGQDDSEELRNAMHKKVGDVPVPVRRRSLERSLQLFSSEATSNSAPFVVPKDRGAIQEADEKWSVHSWEAGDASNAKLPAERQRLEGHKVGRSAFDEPAHMRVDIPSAIREIGSDCADLRSQLATARKTLESVVELLQAEPCDRPEALRRNRPT
ncbi:unnamed protein product [Effrenium voratum]|nr:unnamed protein product [Effrenium voratum]|mmetsp:Transcript_7087/g.16972  ORF Transcript_7087/g.16972 Transcript_7087/m.16972 type:complete len:461 (+) Transcript_7087:116-1498(+)